MSLVKMFFPVFAIGLIKKDYVP